MPFSSPSTSQIFIDEKGGDLFHVIAKVGDIVKALINIRNMENSQGLEIC